jgi:hypothetical protein
VVAGWLLVTSWWSASGVKLAGNGVGDLAELLSLLLKVFGGGGGGVLLEPLGGFLNGLEKLELVLVRSCRTKR